MYIYTCCAMKQRLKYIHTVVIQRLLVIEFFHARKPFVIPGSNLVLFTVTKEGREIDNNILSHVKRQK